MEIEILGKIKLVPMKDHFEVYEPLKFKVDGKEYLIKAKMETDLGSIPKVFRFIFDRFGVETNSYVLHDFGYRVQPKGTDRKYWDNVLRSQQKKDGVNWFKSYLIYKNLRLFGWIAWENNKKIKGELFG
ncbi:DUF1353 domain-containing protein [Psychrilyobacter atlanticus]|uniref:DUF1353 domain-containing protein n=1 Tax=Psychrilyobacter atlanticus TaxID=271091 RepID=UPI00040D9FAC|nr:DUF1353 domain-containing protein [Psychrilyobacter atlanticus]